MKRTFVAVAAVLVLAGGYAVARGQAKDRARQRATRIYEAMERGSMPKELAKARPQVEEQARRHGVPILVRLRRVGLSLDLGGSSVEVTARRGDRLFVETITCSGHNCLLGFAIADGKLSSRSPSGPPQ